MSSDGFIRVSIHEILKCCSLANKEDKQKLIKLFSSSTTYELVIPCESDEAKCLLKFDRNIALHSYINLESLSLAFTRLYFGKSNKELLKRIEKYYRNYQENKIKDEDNSELKNEIILDDEAFNFIKQFSNFNEYENHLIGKNIKRKTLINKQETMQGKSIID